MTRSKLEVPVPRVALSHREAAGAIGRSESWYREHVLPDLKVIRIGGESLVPTRELERWAIESAERTLPERKLRAA